LIALLFVLSSGYHAEAQLKGLLAGSGIIAIILGFAGKISSAESSAGVSFQINRPYKVGDWLQVGERFAEVMEITGARHGCAQTMLFIWTSQTTKSFAKRSSIFLPDAGPCDADSRRSRV